MNTSLPWFTPGGDINGGVGFNKDNALKFLNNYLDGVASELIDDKYKDLNSQMMAKLKTQTDNSGPITDYYKKTSPPGVDQAAPQSVVDLTQVAVAQVQYTNPTQFMVAFLNEISKRIGFNTLSDIEIELAAGGPFSIQPNSNMLSSITGLPSLFDLALMAPLIKTGKTNPQDQATTLMNMTRVITKVPKYYPWSTPTGVDSAKVKKFLSVYMNGVQTEFNKPIYDSFRTNILPLFKKVSELPPMSVTPVGLIIVSLMFGALYDTITADFTKTWLTNLIKNINLMSNVEYLGLLAEIPYELDPASINKKIKEFARGMYNIDFTDDMTNKAATILLAGRAAAIASVPLGGSASGPSSWSPTTGYPVGARVIDNGVTYEKKLPPTAPSANTAGTVWKKVSGGGRRTRGKKSRKASRRR